MFCRVEGTFVAQAKVARKSGWRGVNLKLFRCQRFRSFDSVAEIRALPAANKLHGSSVEMIVVYMLPVPTYDLHVAQFYESVVR